MRTYVLVHGAWGGNHSWRQFAPLLWARGHEVFAPSLTGLGERVHLGGPQTDLSTHIQDVVNCIEYQDLHDIVLVGHSYGGMVVTGVADRLPDRISAGPVWRYFELPCGHGIHREMPQEFAGILLALA